MWIEVHQSLPTHRKTHDLCDHLDIPPAAAVGHLVLLWLWAVDNAPDGDLACARDRTIAQAAGWPGESETFVLALADSGFLDGAAGGRRLHDWDEYTGALQEQQERRRTQKKEQMARYRARRKEREPDSSGPTDTLRRAAVEPLHTLHVGPRRAATVPNLTVPNQTKPRESDDSGGSAPDDRPASAGASAPLALSRASRPRDLIWDALAAIFGEAIGKTERDARNDVCGKLRQAGRDSGRDGAAMAALVAQAHANWPNAMGDATETPHALERHLGALVAGPQVHGRSNGTVRAHTQRLDETARVDRGPKRGSAALDDEWTHGAAPPAAAAGGAAAARRGRKGGEGDAGE